MIDKGRRGNEVRTYQVYGWCSGLGMLSRNKLDSIAISHSRQLHVEQKRSQGLQKQARGEL